MCQLATPTRLDVCRCPSDVACPQNISAGDFADFVMTVTSWRWLLVGDFANFVVLDDDTQIGGDHNDRELLTESVHKNTSVDNDVDEIFYPLL